jgi:hypothetical protein
MTFNEQLLRDMLLELKSLRRTLENRSPSDNRFWEPDETCLPFLWSGWGGGADPLLGRFKIPDGQEGVIAYASPGYAASVADKSSKRIIIRAQDDMEGTLPPIIATQGISVTGSLQKVIEGETPATDVPGLAVLGNFALDYRCRIRLQPGQTYSVWGAGGGTGFITVIFSGWTFPSRPKT